MRLPARCTVFMLLSLVAAVEAGEAPRAQQPHASPGNDARQEPRPSCAITGKEDASGIVIPFVHRSDAHHDDVCVTGEFIYPTPYILQNLCLGNWSDAIFDKHYDVSESFAILKSSNANTPAAFTNAWTVLPRRGLKVLSLGEGYSGLVPYLRELGMEAYGLDLWYGPETPIPDDVCGSAFMKAYRVKYASMLVAGDAGKLEEVNLGQFDAVVGHYLFDYLPLAVRKKLLEGSLRLLKDGGTLRLNYVSSLLSDDCAGLDDVLGYLRGKGLDVDFVLLHGVSRADLKPPMTQFPLRSFTPEELTTIFKDGKYETAIRSIPTKREAKETVLLMRPRRIRSTADTVLKTLDPFYKQHAVADGLLVVGSEKVSEYALREAGYLARTLLAGRPDVLDHLVNTNRLYVCVMAYNEMQTDLPECRSMEAWWDYRARGLGGRPVSCGEENLLGFRGDPWPGENIFIHEFAHATQSAFSRLDARFEARLKALYDNASQSGRFRGYAMNNAGEFWAEGVQSWFNCNAAQRPRGGGGQSSFEVLGPAGEHVCHIRTREQMKTCFPEYAELLDDTFRHTTWVYTPVAERLNEPHLRGYDPAAAPVFSWPPEVIAAFDRAEAEKAKKKN